MGSSPKRKKKNMRKTNQQTHTDNFMNTRTISFEKRVRGREKKSFEVMTKAKG